MFSRFHRIPACDGQTDGLTDGQADSLLQHSPRYACASRDKNDFGIFAIFVSLTLSFNLQGQHVIGQQRYRFAVAHFDLYYILVHSW